MIKVYSNAFHISAHIKSCYGDAARDGFKGEPFAIVKPLVNPPNERLRLGFKLELEKASDNQATIPARESMDA